MTIYKIPYHYIALLILPQQIKHPHASFFVHGNDYEERATIRESIFIQKLNQIILIEFGTAVTQINAYVQTFQYLHEWAHCDTPDAYKLVVPDVENSPVN